MAGTALTRDELLAVRDKCRRVIAEFEARGGIDRINGDEQTAHPPLYTDGFITVEMARWDGAMKVFENRDPK